MQLVETTPTEEVRQVIRTYDTLPMDRTPEGSRTYPSGLVVTVAHLPNGRERWTYDYSGCTY